MNHFKMCVKDFITKIIYSVVEQIINEEGMKIVLKYLWKSDAKKISFAFQQKNLLVVFFFFFIFLKDKIYVFVNFSSLFDLNFKQLHIYGKALLLTFIY